MELSLGDVGCIQITYVEYASASHDALDKTLLPLAAFCEGAIAKMNKEISKV